MNANPLSCKSLCRVVHDAPQSTPRPPRSARSAEQFIEFSGPIECRELIEPADMLVADENLRHGPAPARLLYHGITLAGVLIDLDFLHRHALAVEQIACALAVAAPGR